MRGVKGGDVDGGGRWRGLIEEEEGLGGKRGGRGEEGMRWVYGGGGGRRGEGGEEEGGGGG